MTAFLPQVYSHVKNREILQKFYQSGNIPQTIVFSGPRGIGKQFLAQQWAQFLLCELPDKKDNFCGQCDSCRHMQNKDHPDHVVLAPETNKSGNKSISIENVRKVIETTQYKGLHSKIKVMIIDEADSLSFLSQNALLKTLEDVSPDQYIILISHQRQALLKTVLSRSIELRFRLLSQDQLKSVWHHSYAKGLFEEPVNEALLPFLAGSLNRLHDFLQDDGVLLREYQDFFRFIAKQFAQLAQENQSEMEMVNAAETAAVVQWLEKWSQIDKERLLWLTDFIIAQSRQALVDHLAQDQANHFSGLSIDFWQEIVYSTMDFKKYLQQNGNAMLGLSFWLNRISQNNLMRV